MSENGMKNNVSSLSVSAKEFVPQQNVCAATEDETFEEVTVATTELWTCPEEFFHTASVLVHQLERRIVDERTFCLAVDQLFRQCIHLPNFQNTGARLCCYIFTHLTNNYSGNFRVHLMNRLKDEYLICKDFVNTSEGQTRLIGFTVFMAELMNLMAVGGDVLPLFPPKVTELLSLLLTVANNESIKWTINVLKLSGKALDCLENRAKLNSLFEQIKQILVGGTESVNIHKNQRLNLLNMVELRAFKWNVEEMEKSYASNDSEVTVTASHNPYANMKCEPVTYDADGQPILYDEDIYLDQLGDYGNSCQSSSYPVDNGYQGDVAYYGIDGAGVSFEGGDVHSLIDGAGVGFEGGDVHTLQRDLNNLEIVYDGDDPYVIESEDMDPEMFEAYETYVASTEKKKET